MFLCFHFPASELGEIGIGWEMNEGETTDVLEEEPATPLVKGLSKGTEPEFRLCKGISRDERFRDDILCWLPERNKQQHR